MKSKAKKIVAFVLGWQVRRLLNKNDVAVVAVGGSIGKTSTKLAIAHTLSQHYRVNYEKGNYNDIVTIPLVFFGGRLASLFNPFSWLMTFVRNEGVIAKKYPYDVVVLELGTDGPGQIKQFKSYVRADIAVITAITPEHMEYFADLDEVAHEELAISQFSRQLLVNADLVAAKYIQEIKEPLTYGIKEPANYRLKNIEFSGDQASFEIYEDSKQLLKSNHQKITEPQLYSVTAAAAVGHLMGLTPQQIDIGISSIPAVSGRMQQLEGLKDSLIIDDTYNASPEATRAALDTLCRLQAPQRIAVLGNMNELGKYSRAEHEAIGQYINADKIDLLVTIGPDANKYLAAKALERGLNVKTFEDPVSAGLFIKENLSPGAAVLVKGSQNKVFAEETVKQILANPADASKLVRQSGYWMSLKKKNFKT